MSELRRYEGEDARREAAADWVVRLRADEIAEADILAFDAWLSSSPENARAYDQAVEILHAYVRNAGRVAEGLSRRRAGLSSRRRAWLGAGAVAAAAAGALFLVPQFRAPETQTYATGIGERRTVTLADGSTVDLNAATRLSVTLRRDRRDVTLEQGEAVFDVAHDAGRPFEIAAGDRAVRVVGTQFDVRRRDGDLSVTVARGAVEVRPAGGAGGRAYRLHPGQQLEHREGAAQVSVGGVDPQEVLGWRTGRLVYREEPLGQVVADLNHQFATPMRIEDPVLAATPISGVLVLDDQDAVIRRLALLVPISAVPSATGLVLRREGAPVQ
ncbi:FecR family protein [Phenylobacterium sp. VNQ135]|uniref:FecR family protein n=1 Tax=Phenylobacterium sp. VNQ135 TaxID=3400922 RepID=UPI003BFF0448